MQKRLWTLDEWKFCLECFAKSDTIIQAQKAFKRKFQYRTWEAIRKKFTKEGLKTPSSYLRTSTVFDPSHHLGILREEEKKKIIEKSEIQELKELKKRQTIIDLLLDSVRAEVHRLPRPKDIKPIYTRTPNGQKEEVIAVVSDVQIGEFVDRDAIGGLGEYNFEIFELRVQHWKSSVINILQMKMSEGRNIEKLHIPFIGDIVEGMDIFPSQPFHIESGLVKQTMRGSLVFAKAIAEIALLFPELPILIKHVAGNHGRIGRKGTTPYADNWDRMLGFLIGMQLEQYPNIINEVPEVWFIVEHIQGWTFHFSHGDDIKSWMGVPAYGLIRAHSKETVMLDMPLHYYIVGHHHVLSQIQNGYGEVIVNGNWVGANEFVAKQIKSASRPCQVILSVTEQYGVGDRFVCYFESKFKG